RNLHNKILFKQIDIPNVHLTGINAAAVMEMILAEHPLSEDKQIKLFTHLRLAYAFKRDCMPY
ncbi:unnamed protein product, partial [Rotaria magnacalcarata]